MLALPGGGPESESSAELHGEPEDVWLQILKRNTLWFGSEIPCPGPGSSCEEQCLRLLTSSHSQLLISQHDHSVFLHPFIVQCHLFLLETREHFFFHISCSTQSIISHKVALFLSDIERGGQGSTKPALVHPSHVSRTQLSGLLCTRLRSPWPDVLNTRVLYHSLLKIYLHFSFILSPRILFLFVLHPPKWFRCMFFS